MKKFLITIAPFFILLFIVMLFLWGLKGMLAFFGAALFVVVAAILMAKWAEFVEKHIKD